MQAVLHNQSLSPSAINSSVVRNVVEDGSNTENVKTLNPVTYPQGKIKKMRAVVQRVKSASVTVNGELVSEIGAGVLIFLGVAHDDTATELEYIANKVANLRIFEDEDGKMNRSLLETEGAALVVSQFTLYGDCRKGRRPSFINAARPEVANTLYEQFITLLKQQNIPTQGGTFQAMMDVQLINDGPVTILLDSDKQF